MATKTEDMNATRRLVKQRQAAAARAAAASRKRADGAGESFSMDLVRQDQKDRARRERARLAGIANGDRLLETVIQKGALYVPGEDDNGRNVRDVIAAAKRSPLRFRWEADGQNLRIALVKPR